MIASLLGGLIKTILSPIVKLIFSALYSILIKGPLQLLNIEDRILGYAVGGYTDKLLFNTSLVDGKPQLNFFSSDSPLKPFYMSMLAAGGLLLTIFIGFAILGTFSKNKGKPGIVKKLGQVTLSASAVVIVPTAFITAVSLSGSIISSLSGKNVSASKNDITTYKGFLNDRLNAVASGQYNSISFNKTIKSDFNQELMNEKGTSPWRVGNQKQTLDINQIYRHLTDKDGDFQPSEDIRALATQSKDYYKDMNDSLFRYNQSVPTFKLNYVNENGVNLIGKTKSIISKLTPKYKNEQDTDIVKDLMSSLSDLQSKIIAWKKSVDSLLSYLPEKVVVDQNAALHNLKSAFGVIWGSEKQTGLQVANIAQLNKTIAEIIDGSSKTGTGGLYTLKQQISNFNDSTLVTTFYQVVTGNKDTNWNRSFPGLKNGGMMLLIGFIMILGAILMLAGIIIEAFIRIILLGLLFIFGGLLVPLSPLDNGARIKTWINVVVGQLISIFGVIIILRFGFMIMDRFGELINSQTDFSGSEGYLTKSISMAFFAYAVMQGANKSRAMLLQIAGSNQGLMSNPGAWAKQFTGGFGRVWNSGRKFSGGVGKGLGLSSRMSSGVGGLAGAGGSVGAQGGRWNNFKSTWSARHRKAISTLKAPDRMLASATRGKYGSMDARTSALESRSAKYDAKRNAANSKVEMRRARPGLLAKTQNRLKSSKQNMQKSKEFNKMKNKTDKGEH